MKPGSTQKGAAIAAFFVNCKSETTPAVSFLKHFILSAVVPIYARHFNTVPPVPEQIFMDAVFHPGN